MSEDNVPASAREWVLARYRDGDPNFDGVTSDEWGLAVAFCENLAKCVGTRSQIAIVPKWHVDGRSEIGIAVIYEGHTDVAEKIQLEHPEYESVSMALWFKQLGCCMSIINNWSTAIVRD